MSNDPIHQFQISKLIPIEIGGLDLSFTNSSAFMAATAVAAGAFLFFSTSNRALVPSAHAVDGRNVLRVRRLDAARRRRQRKA